MAMRKQLLDYAARPRQDVSPACRLSILMMIGLLLCLIAFTASFLKTVLYVGGG